jgi:hypothetical protein
MRRRRFLLASAGLAAGSLAAPRLARAQDAGALKFVPFVDPPMLDPIASPNYAVRNQAPMIFDTLYGIDEQFQPQPQMIEGVERAGVRWGSGSPPAFSEGRGSAPAPRWGHTAPGPIRAARPLDQRLGLSADLFAPARPHPKLRPAAWRSALPGFARQPMLPVGRRMSVRPLRNAGVRGILRKDWRSE